MTKTIVSNAQALLARRNKVVPKGVGIFAPTTAQSGSGPILTDLDGEEWIDFGSGIGVTALGHCPPTVVRAIQQQAEKLIHACFHVSTYEPYVALCEKLIQLFPHGDATKVMLTNTGAEAIENAIKIARQATGRPAIICYTEAFHGRSMMAMTLTSKISYKIGCGPFAPEVYRLPFPNYYYYGDGLTESAFIEREIQRLDIFLNSHVDPHSVAAIVIEPVQGEGGFNVVPKAYLQALRKKCTELGILLIIDEVQTGFGRTGKWAAYQHYDVVPDISTWAKAMGGGLPIGCVIGKAEIMDATTPGTLGGTYLGNPVCCAAALATIEYMESINLPAKAQTIGQILRRRLKSMQVRFPQIGDVRGLGAMLAIELVRPEDSKKPNPELCTEILEACWKRNLLILPAGMHKNIIRFLVPLIIEEELLQKGLDILEDAFEQVCSAY
ncbi:MAG: aspartate aminotransferase family protein [Bacteroidia bacterium]|nr:aspartate aminotransferase family protein [Bacteroidia bacterium]MDW8158469.1 aspartate aminotransferase family protein [Bacteroidia bacterium]